MAQRVNLDAMIRREDFGVKGQEYTLDLFKDFPISNLEQGQPIFRLLRKPDFQRETNHWSPEQIATFIESFVDNEVIPGLILWKAPDLIFVLDGGHRLSALRAWMEDDYGDGPITAAFYRGGISNDQKKAAKRARSLIEKRVGRYQTLRQVVGHPDSANSKTAQRATRAFTRSLSLQWVQGPAPVAESSFYKINSQGTPLDATETTLNKNRRKPIAISARAILRAGTGNKYWAVFPANRQAELEERASEFFRLLFEPEADAPVKTLDLPLGGAVSPVDALSVLIEFLTIAGSPNPASPMTIADYSDDETGEETLSVLGRALDVLNRVSGNSPGSLGLHPAVYFYNERGKHNRYLFLGITQLIAERVRNNDGGFFRKFSSVREKLEKFLMDNKSWLSLLLTNMSRTQRISKTRDLFVYLVTTFNNGGSVTPEPAITSLGLKGRFFNIEDTQYRTKFSDDAKSMAFLEAATKSGLKCPICRGMLDPRKSVSYDHKQRIREGGTGEAGNAQLAHPYCNTAVRN
ncbi:GmrSD restriction endonuclease domain-containing protein [Nitrobacter sp. TKz-YC01]|uniref:GmrSD restriction endonuclease domain-containing protein n=1 Tax=Nitrobacter sp. TKz-YC01 TaxID=3398703 RepID=UPI003A0FC65C